MTDNGLLAVDENGGLTNGAHLLDVDGALGDDDLGDDSADEMEMDAEFEPADNN